MAAEQYRWVGNHPFNLLEGSMVEPGAFIAVDMFDEAQANYYRDMISTGQLIKVEALKTAEKPATKTKEGGE